MALDDTRRPGFSNFLRAKALKRGLWMVLAAVLLGTIGGSFLKPGVIAYDIYGGAMVVLMGLGILLVVCGVIAKMVGLGGRKALK